MPIEVLDPNPAETEYGWLSLALVKCLDCGWTWYTRVEHPKRCPGCQRQIEKRKLQGGDSMSCPSCDHEWITRKDQKPMKCPLCFRKLPAR